MTQRHAAFNPAVRAMTPPPIPTVQSWIAQYDGRHGPLIDLSQAVPGYAPHAQLLGEISRLATEPSLAGYGDIEGEPAQRAAFADYMSGQLSVPLTLDNVQVTAGCNQAFVAAMLTLAAPGDRVLLTNPCFFNNESALTMLGLRPGYVACHASDGFAPDPSAVADAIEAQDAKVVALVSPNNPTGAVYSSETLQAIQAVCRERGAWLVLDETYSDFIEEGSTPRHNLLAQVGWDENTILLYSFSKVYCTPGLRVGAIVAGAAVIAETAKVMDNLQICAPRHAQVALAGAVSELGAWRAANTVEIKRRADAFCAALETVSEWSIAAIGAYFAYVRHPFSGVASMEVAERLARDAGVLCLPGTFFGSGQEDYLRIAFANVDANEIALIPDRLRRLADSA